LALFLSSAISSLSFEDARLRWEYFLSVNPIMPHRLRTFHSLQRKFSIPGCTRNSRSWSALSFASALHGALPRKGYVASGFLPAAQAHNDGGARQ
jgi:hypothetical protein